LCVSIKYHCMLWCSHWCVHRVHIYVHTNHKKSVYTTIINLRFIQNELIQNI
jgi:hypothetical protein